MNTQIYRSIAEPIRQGITWEEKWRGQDKGLIICWEVGREQSRKEPTLALLAKKGELPPLGWKGGILKKTKKTEKYGSYNYLAKWQGIRGDDLNIDLSIETEHICSKTGMKVIFTAETDKFTQED